MAKFRIGGVAASLLCALASLPGDAKAAPASFTGNFGVDSDQREFFFNLAAAGPVTIRTWSYGGGSNAAGASIPAGGFDSTLSIYDASGTLIAINEDGGCGVVASDPVTHSCWDAYVSLSLPAGSYRAVLTQSTNLPAGPTLADSFIYNVANLFANSNLVNGAAAPPFGGQANFTQPPGSAAGGFWDFFPSQRTSFYALDIVGASTASAPAITTSATLPFGITGTNYSPVSLSVQSGGGVTYTWTPPASGLPPGLTLTAGGVLSGQPTTAGTYTFVAMATDGVQPVQQTETLVVYNPLAITTSSLPSAQGGSPYGPVQLNASGGSGTLVWTATGLPAGLALSSAGVLTGVVPFSAAQFSVTAKDTVTNQTASQTLALSVTVQPLTISGGGTLPEVAAGAAVSSNFVANGGTFPYTFSSSNLPPGLSLSAGGVVSGQANSPGNFTFNVGVSDGGGQSASTSASLSVLGIVSASLPPGIKGSSYSFNFAAAGGTGQYIFSASGLPGGLSLSSSGALSGKPASAGAQPFTVMVSDGVVTASASASITVADSGGPVSLSVSGGTLTAGQVNVAYTGSLTATGGTVPYAWALIGGVLPDGLSLSSAGAISGTPTTAGSYAFTAQVTDNTSATAQGAFTIAIAPAPLVLISGNSLPNGVVGSDYPLQIFSATGGTAPYAFSISAGSLPSGLNFASAQISGIPLSAVTAPFTVTVTDAAGKTASAALSITVNTAQADLILSQTFLTYSTMVGATTPPTPDNVTVRSSVVQQLLNYSYSITPSVPWLTVAGGTITPGSLSISLTGDALTQPASATPYQASIVVTCVAPSPCSGRSQTISVALAVSAPPPQLSISNQVLSFIAGTGTTAAVTAPLGIQNTGGGSLAISSITAADNWVNISNVPSSVASGSPAAATVTVNPSGLPPGYSHSAITVVSAAGVKTVYVSVFVSASAIMRAAPEGLQFSLPAGGSLSPSTGSFQVSVAGGLPVNWTASVLPGAPWLSLASGSGMSTQDSAASAGFAIDGAAASQLSQGVMYGTIRITSPDVTNSPQDFHVTLRVAPPASLPAPNPMPAGLLFQTGLTASKMVTVFASAATPLPYQASAATTGGGTWLSVSPSTGVSSAVSPASSTVSVNPAGLAPGIYTGLVSYAFSAAAVRSVNVTYIVTGTATPGAITLFEPRADSACAPKQLVATQTGLVSNFAQLATLPVPLQIVLTDNCGRPVVNGQVNISFTNGDSPLLLTPVDDVSGIYSATWIPRGVSPQVTVSATATAPGLPSTTARVNGEVAAFTGPLVTQNAVLSVFNPVVGGAISPGSILQIYGSNLSASTATSSTLPLTASLGGTSVLIGGNPVPLYYVSPGQINAQSPFELNPGNQYQVVVNTAGALTPPATINVTPTAPGIAAFPNGQIIAQHLDGTLVSDISPAAPGTYVVFYLAGLGATDVPVETGAASPVSPLAHPKTAPVLTLNGVQQPYQFVGLTPGIVGLYQINFLVPTGTPDGNYRLVVSQSGAPGNQVILPVRK